MQALIIKKANITGIKQQRFITLGLSQILISLDNQIQHLVNVIPLIKWEVIISKSLDSNNF